MSKTLLALLVGGLVPAVLFGASGVMQKTARATSLPVQPLTPATHRERELASAGRLTSRASIHEGGGRRARRQSAERPPPNRGTNFPTRRRYSP